MLKIIKKWYFKVYHLFKLIGIFILIFGIKEKVYAVETIPFQTKFIESTESCTNNLLDQTFVFNGRITNGRTTYMQNSLNISSYLIKIKPSTTYTMSNNYEVRIRGKWVSFLKTKDTATYGVMDFSIQNINTFTTPNDANYLIVTYWFNQAYNDYTTLKVMLNEGNEAMEYEDFSANCVPPTPPGPTPDTTYSSFLTLYINKIEYLAEGFTSNPYLIAMIGIIISWVILELFLKILNLRGGYKK